MALGQVSCSKVTGKGAPGGLGVTWDPTWFGMQSETASNVSRFPETPGSQFIVEVNTIAYNDVSCATGQIPVGVVTESSCDTAKVLYTKSGICAKTGVECLQGETCDCNQGDPGCSCVGGNCVQLCRTRRILPGASLMGWAASCREPTACPSSLLGLSNQVATVAGAPPGSQTWVNLRLPVPSTPIRTSFPDGTGANETWNLLWGDPAITHLRGLQGNVVFLANLAGQNHPAAGASDPLLNGACVARSIDGGVSFSLWGCLRDPAINGGNGFYDGGSLAVDDQDRLYVAYWDTRLTEVAVWISSNTGAAQGSFLKTTNPFPDDFTVVGHPLIRVGPAAGAGRPNRVYVMAPVRRSATDPRVDLWSSVLDTDLVWGPPRKLVEDFAHDVTIAYGIGPDTFPLSVRTARQFSFDVGFNAPTTQDEVEYAFTFRDSVNGVCIDGLACKSSAECSGGGTCQKVTHVQAGQCSVVLGAGSLPELSCADVSDWSSADGSSLRRSNTDQYNPEVAAARDADGNTTWRLVYKSREFDFDAICADGSDCSSSPSCLDGSACRPVGTGPFVQAMSTELGFDQDGFSLFSPKIAHPLGQKVCSSRVGYWGDYDTIAAMEGVPRGFLIGYTDSSAVTPPGGGTPAADECKREDMQADPMHVNASYVLK